MSVLIDLAAYLDEVSAFVALAERLADGREAESRLFQMRDDLRRGLDFGRADWSWETPQPIVFEKSRAYDGPGRRHVEAHLEIAFDCFFTRDAKVARKSTVWHIARCATHVRLYKGGRVLPCHFDYKNGHQWGPQLHFQVSEELCEIPIPRIPSGFFLPTDCADFALAELHHEEWRRLQASSRRTREVSVLRHAQENRVRSYLADVHSHWKRDNRSTRVCMLQNYTSTVVALPDHHGRVAKQS